MHYSVYTHHLQNILNRFKCIKCLGLGVHVKGNNYLSGKCFRCSGTGVCESQSKNLIDILIREMEKIDQCIYTEN